MTRSPLETHADDVFQSDPPWQAPRINTPHRLDGDRLPLTKGLVALSVKVFGVSPLDFRLSPFQRSRCAGEVMSCDRQILRAGLVVHLDVAVLPPSRG